MAANGRNFPDWIAAFLEYSKDVEAPKSYLRWSALSVISAALERKVWLRTGSYTHYPNLFVLLVGEAGIRKSSASGQAVSLLWEVPGIGKLSNRLNEATLLTELSIIGQRKKVEIGGKLYRTCAGFLYASEGSDIFKEMYQGGGVIDILTSLYDGGGVDKHGWHENNPWVKSTKKDGFLALHNPLLSFLACTTPASLPKLVSKSEAEGGFGSRTLLVVHKGMVPKRYAWVEEGHHDIEMRLKLVEDLRTISLMKGPYIPDDGFKELYPELERKHDEALGEKRAHSLVAGFLSRKMTHAAKLSQVVAASRRTELKLKASDLAEAWKLLSDLEPTMLEAYGTVGITPEARSRNEVWEYLRKKKLPRFVKNEIQVIFQDLLSPKQVTQAIDELRDLGKVRYEPLESRGGRHVYTVIDFSLAEQSPGSLSLGR
jgi:hypothetical protein